MREHQGFDGRLISWRSRAITGGLLLYATVMPPSLSPSEWVGAQSQRETTLRYTLATRVEMEGMRLPTGGGEMLVLVRGNRERREDRHQQLVTLTQCDLQRTIYINVRDRTCLIQPFIEIGERSREESAAPQHAARRSGVPRRGGIVSIRGEITDTGERKQMFGRPARRLLVRQVLDASPDACSPGRFEMTLELWVTDLPIWSCDVRPMPPLHLVPTARPDCVDRFRIDMKGDASLLNHLPLFTKATMTVQGQTMSVIAEVTDLSTTPSDAALFEMPADCRQIADAEAFWASVGRQTALSFSEAMKTARSAAERETRAVPAKRTGLLRIGVQLTDESGASLDIVALREQVIAALENGGGGQLEAIGLVAADPAALKAEAEAKHVDYILALNLREAKPDWGRRLGGLLGRRAGIETSEKTTVRLDYRWIEPTKMETLVTRSLGQDVKGKPEEAAATFCRSAAQEALAELWRRVKR